MFLPPYFFFLQILRPSGDVVEMIFWNEVYAKHSISFVDWFFKRFQSWKKCPQFLLGSFSFSFSSSSYMKQSFWPTRINWPPHGHWRQWIQERSVRDNCSRHSCFPLYLSLPLFENCCCNILTLCTLYFLWYCILIHFYFVTTSLLLWPKARTNQCTSCSIDLFLINASRQ